MKLAKRRNCRFSSLHGMLQERLKLRRQARLVDQTDDFDRVTVTLSHVETLISKRVYEIEQRVAE